VAVDAQREGGILVSELVHNRAMIGVGVTARLELVRLRPAVEQREHMTLGGGREGLRDALFGIWRILAGAPHSHMRPSAL
jgi:hypothetical protein